MSIKRLSDGARCADRSIVPDPDLFFPDGTSGDQIEAQIEAAKQVCQKCPVRRQCLVTALAGGTSTAYGVWGGETETQRRYNRHAKVAARSAA
ncbi:WhiB family transcriptional regulator [Streptosporangium sp. NPDC000563]|uniref:WhiB family transcriptional regulator n=1 Tax=Streptosporangium sp. NPDC000563 TaxID=3154366 RepID=UPI0033291B93